MCEFGPLSTVALLMNKVSTSRSGRFIRAFATALATSFFTKGAPAFVVKSRSCRASEASRPLTRSTMIRAFRGLIL